MSKIVFISCVSKKKDVPSRAEDLYDSALYNYSLRYAKKLKPDRIFILSALYGLVKLKEVIEPYDLTLNDMKTADKKAWSKRVLVQMNEEGLDFKKDEFVFLAGNNYRQYLVEHLMNVDIPMQGLGIGKQLQFLKKAVN